MSANLRLWLLMATLRGGSACDLVAAAGCAASYSSASTLSGTCAAFGTYTSCITTTLAGCSPAFTSALQTAFDQQKSTLCASGGLCAGQSVCPGSVGVAGPTPSPTPPTVPPGTGSLASAAIGTYFGTLFGTWGALIAQVVLMLLFACLYWQKVVKPIVEGEGTLEMHKEKFKKQEDDFVVNICQCFDDMWVCLHGWCCPLARMGHTNEVAGILGYWETAILWCCCAMFIPYGPCCLTVWFRMKLKEIMNIKDNIFNDIVIACCCPCLSICQQGTAVDRAMGYEVVGCCDLEWNDGKLRDMDAYDA